MELLDIVDENNNLIGKSEERNIVHEKGLWHRHVGAWIMNEKGEILFQNWELISIEKSTKDDNSNHNFTYSFFTKVNYKIEEYTMQKEEVADLKYMTLEEMQEKRDNQDENYMFIYWNDFDKILEILKEKRNELLKDRN